MKWNELKARIIAEYDSRHLKSNVRYSALNKIDTFLKDKYPSLIDEVKSTLPADKEIVKRIYEQYSNKTINAAESSVINEIYKQLQRL